MQASSVGPFLNSFTVITYTLSWLIVPTAIDADSAGQFGVHSQDFSGHNILLKAELGLESLSLSILDVLCHLMLPDPFMISGQMRHFHRSHLCSFWLLSHLHFISLDKSGIHKSTGPVAHSLENELMLSKICDIGHIWNQKPWNEAG